MIIEVDYDPSNNKGTPVVVNSTAVQSVSADAECQAEEETDRFINPSEID